MKKHRWFAALAVMVMALAVAGCSNPSSGTGNSGDDNPVSQQPDYSKCVVGDFVLKDGTILSKDKTPESDTVATLIVRASGFTPPLVVFERAAIFLKLTIKLRKSLFFIQVLVNHNIPH